jgi:DNA repair exonuclease SbcCD ATPase subunit
MAKPLSSPDTHRGGTNGAFNIRAALADASAADPHAAPHGKPHAADAGPEFDAEELRRLRTENADLRILCTELEQALQEASQHGTGDYEERVKEYEALLEEKNEVIRGLHQDLQAAQCALAEAEAVAQGPQKRVPTGPVPREDELLALSEELEQERRQLQEDEQTLMDQMREMEVSMAKERAEMARQRNDLQRLQNEIRHELERLEKNGAIQSKIENLKSKLQDVSSRRGAAPTPAAKHEPAPKPAPQAPAADGPPPKKRESFIGRLFG